MIVKLEKMFLSLIGLTPGVNFTNMYTGSFCRPKVCVTQLLFHQHYMHTFVPDSSVRDSYNLDPTSAQYAL